MTKKTLFLLKGIFHQKIDKKYHFDVVFQNRECPIEKSRPILYNEKIEEISQTTLSSFHRDGNEQDPSRVSPEYGDVENGNRTNIADLPKHDPCKVSFTFLDEAKKDHQCVVSMYNHIGNELPTSTTICCYWCRHPFESVPIGCPIYYAPHRIVKKMTSDTSKEGCHIRESVSKQIFQKIKGNLDHVPITEKDFYVVDGIFCSFPCCLAFIHEHKHKNPTYRDSEYLLRQMCQKIHGDQSSKPVMITKAPSWRLLQDYGGHLSISNFRKCFENTNFITNNQLIHELPRQKVVGYLFEKQITL